MKTSTLPAALRKPAPITALVPIELDDRAKARAVKAIEDIHLAYNGEGGINDMAKALQKRVNTTAGVIYSLARYASERTNTATEAADYFKELCAHAEEHYKTAYGVTDLRAALPSWAAYKSNIVRGVLQLDLDPADYRSERQFRIAADEKRAALSPPAKGEARAREKTGPPPVSLAEVPRGAQPLVLEIVSDLDALMRGKTPEAIEILRETKEKLDPLVDKRKLQ